MRKRNIVIIAGLVYIYDMWVGYRVLKLIGSLDDEPVYPTLPSIFLDLAGTL